MSENLTEAEARGRAERATVRMVGMGGRGVLVPGGYVLTAVHCIEWDGQGGMVLGDHFLEPVETHDGRAFLLSPASVDPVADVALLAGPDDQALPEDAMRFCEFAAATEPVPLRTEGFAWGEPVPVFFRNADGRWCAATATRYGEGAPSSGQLCIETEVGVEGGASGGPIIDADGSLVGVVSNTSDGTWVGSIPFAYLALPRWASDRICAAAEAEG